MAVKTRAFIAGATLSAVAACSSPEQPVNLDNYRPNSVRSLSGFTMANSNYGQCNLRMSHVVEGSKVVKILGPRDPEDCPVGAELKNVGAADPAFYRGYTEGSRRSWDEFRDAAGALVGRNVAKQPNLELRPPAEENKWVTVIGRVSVTKTGVQVYMNDGQSGREYIPGGCLTDGAPALGGVSFDAGSYYTRGQTFSGRQTYMVGVIPPNASRNPLYVDKACQPGAIIVAPAPPPINS